MTRTLLTTAAVGFHRDDGDFQLLATLNNNDELIAPERFTHLVHVVRDQLQAALSETGEYSLEVFERQDAPDYVTLDEVDEPSAAGEAA